MTHSLTQGSFTAVRIHCNVTRNPLSLRLSGSCDSVACSREQVIDSREQHTEPNTPCSVLALRVVDFYLIFEDDVWSATTRNDRHTQKRRKTHKSPEHLLFTLGNKRTSGAILVYVAVDWL